MVKTLTGKIVSSASFSTSCVLIVMDSASGFGGYGLDWDYSIGLQSSVPSGVATFAVNAYYNHYDTQRSNATRE
jgi:hypothetical protein